MLKKSPTMEGRLRKYGAQASPNLPRNHHQHNHHERKALVVYYLCKNHHLQHPHFIEVPISSPQGLHLRDFIKRLVELRGKRMPSMYSWSCKRRYKNGFVWHDLSDDDTILPAHDNEYVLKGSELLDQSPPGRIHRNSTDVKLATNSKSSPTSSKTQEASSSSSPVSVIKELKRSAPCDSDSPGPSEFGARKPVHASTQTDDESLSRGKTETLESLIRAELRRMNTFRILGGEEVYVPTGRTRLRATNVLMQLITCGSTSVKGHNGFAIVPTYKSRYPNAKYSSLVFFDS